MADGTRIEWTEATWNPITGCSIASPGCTNCYAMKLAGTRMKRHESRAGLTQDSKAGPVWTGEVRFNENWLDQPVRWKRGRMIFVCAHGDLFHESVPDAWIDRVFSVMANAPQHTFQVLTKRSGRMRRYLTALPERIRDMHCDPGLDFSSLPLPNVWLGVSVEDQARADERVADLRATPAAMRWLSCEPLLEEISFDPCELSAIDWIVVGGESGKGARPMHPDWVRSLRDQCAVACGVPFFFKQWGDWAPICEMSDEAIDAAYYPAPERRPDASRQCKVDQCVLHRNADRFDGRAMFNRPAFEQGSGAMTMMAIGKRKAGRAIDGLEHDEYPEANRG
ncbi:MAG: phage Gp37/Gp68 family protein [Pseudomonadota bacterium]|nr:phage Gp37/Gp68 family protein [Pseudomonadota bacterium]MEE3153964.1 phage Gp37/Gp68 family protein [Pseudomonadota bacterium]